IAVRCRKANGQWGAAVLLATLSPKKMLALTCATRREQKRKRKDPAAVLLAYVHFYDQRGGGVESSVKQDKQGLGITKRNKKRFEAQQMLVQLAALAHNVLVWGRNWLAPAAPGVSQYGIARLVRDVFGVGGAVETDSAGHICRIILNQASRLARRCLNAFQLLLAPAQVLVILGET